MVPLKNSNMHSFATLVDQSLPLCVKYAIRHWSHHLFAADINREILALLESFCKKNMLYWIEALVLMGEASIAVEALQKARSALVVGHRSRMSHSC